jgi:hypothetical protein
MTMSRKFFGSRFAQVVPAAEVNAMHDRYIVPTPGKIYWDGLVSAAGKIRWANPDRAPLLLNGGGAAGGVAAPIVNVKTVNAIDSPSFLSDALSSLPGERVVLNFLRANARAVKAALA